MVTREEHKTTASFTNLAEMLNDCSIDRVMAIDREWNIIAWNRTSELITGIDRHDVIGKNLLVTFPQISDDPEMLKAIEGALSGNKTFLPANYISYNRQYSENHFIPLRNEEGEVVGVMNLIHDVAHRIKVEKRLQKLNAELARKYDQLAKANKELANFTYITSRDIKEPLKQVYTSLELLVRKEASALSNMSKGNLRRMQGSLNKMNLLLDDILTISAVTSNDEELVSVNLNEVCEKVLSQLSVKIIERSAKVTFDPLPVMKGHPRMLEYLFSSMIDNGIKFQNEANIPSLHITSSTISGEESGIPELDSDEDYVRLDFIDNGIGFDEQDSERIFRMFERLHDRRFHGSGIGLTICKKIIDAHEGHIHVKSQPGVGSTFSCFLPVR